MDLALYVLLPIMVIMMAFMKLIEGKGVLAWFSRILSPTLRIFGVPGIGVLAMLQLLLVSFAAPVATLVILNDDGTSRRQIAATLAMILAMSQANAVFPLSAVGLSLPIVFLTSLLGGLAAAAATYYLLARTADPEPPQGEPKIRDPQASPRTGSYTLLLEGGRDGAMLVLRAVPLIVLAIFLVNALRALGAIGWIEAGLSPVLERVGLTGAAVLPLVTKYLAGGTAMLGVALELVQEGTMTTTELNRIAGFMINPLDLVGVTVLLSAGSRVAAMARPAILGASIGIVIRGFLHLLIF